MNIIEDIRDALLYVVENRSPPPRTPIDLWTVLKDEWCELPPRYLQTLVESMPHRVAALLCAWGPYTILGRCTSFSGSSVYIKRFIFNKSVTAYPLELQSSLKLF
ncbi:hypothetical protein AVEN_226484-1 [Araneus ventricosus]|uniref:Uncharacterized protein n=1 Tax=Araneus ventricosus TaxID=182803 RepID=A0A4Y2E4M2_ARAVE|nr:hypothetical protein AVEN_226484-1 [Araneus ventricosus]